MEKTNIKPLSILKGGSAAEILEPNEKEGEVMIITQTAGKTSGMTDTVMNIPKLPDWPSKKKNEVHSSLCWWSEILDLKKRGYVDLPDKSGMSVLFCVLYAGMVWGNLMVLFLSVGHLIATIGVHMSKVKNIAIW
jgi:hypothetical protein